MEPSWRATLERETIPEALIQYMADRGCVNETRFANFIDNRGEVLPLLVEPALGMHPDNRKYKATNILEFCLWHSYMPGWPRLPIAATKCKFREMFPNICSLKIQFFCMQTGPNTNEILT